MNIVHDETLKYDAQRTNNQTKEGNQHFLNLVGKHFSSYNMGVNKKKKKPFTVKVEL